MFILFFELCILMHTWRLHIPIVVINAEISFLVLIQDKRVFYGINESLWENLQKALFS